MCFKQNQAEYASQTGRLGGGSSHYVSRDCCNTRKPLKNVSEPDAINRAQRR